jgi:hypothetical protein
MKLDAVTLTLLTNDDVIAVNQDALGKQGIPLVRKGRHRNLGEGYGRWVEGDCTV